MKSKYSPNKTRKLFSLSFAVYVVCILCLLQTAHAQTHTNIFTFDNDVKQYTTAMATNPMIPGDVGETVMAGTIFNISAGKNVIHFLNVDGNGNINVDKYIDINGYNDERAVSIVSDGNNTYYITCLARDPVGNDEIVVLYLQVNGTVTATRRLRDPAQSIYPLSSIFSHGILYICGYATTNYTNLPNTPNIEPYGSTRAAFIQFDPALPAGPLNAAWVINTTVIAGTPPYDYDIAMRMVEMHNGKIFITGSVNDGNAANQDCSATMNIVFDPIPQTFSTNHFRYQSSSQVLEYGIGLVEDVTHGVNYVIGNNFTHGGGGILPGHLNITGLDNSMTPSSLPFNTSRIQFPEIEYGMWALQTLPTVSMPTFPGDARFVIGGMTSYDFCIKYHQADPNPFLYDVEVNYVPGSGALTHYFKNFVTYKNMNGTGNLASNGYFYLGGFLSNQVWNPVFAARATPADDIMLNAPRWDVSQSKLNLKQIRADASTFIETSCTGSYDQYLAYPASCNQPASQTIMPALCTTTYGPLSITIADIKSSSSLFPDGNTQCSATNVVYKSTGITKIEKTDVTTIYPNPANTDINVMLDKNITGSDKIKLQLVNMYGQVVADLYEGSAAQLNSNAKLQLPGVAAGLYNVQIFVNNRIKETIKLTIQ